MGVGAILEPLIVIVLLFGGTWINRSPISWNQRRWVRRRSGDYSRGASPDRVEPGLSSATNPASGGGLLSSRSSSRSSSPATLRLHEGRWHKRRIGAFGLSYVVTSPNTSIFRDRFLSRLLQKFPFLVECWYWVLIYWTYQLGRAFTAVTLQEGTVNVARKHALQLIRVEEKLGIFWEVDIQKLFLRHGKLMTVINWLYSFIHIPGSIAFLVWLYYYTTTRRRFNEWQSGKIGDFSSWPSAGPSLYQARRRTMAVCNLLAFVVFTMWPCMPPRLLSDENVEGPEGDLGRSYGFIDTVHGTNGAKSVWTQNRFCNQYAAMPSLHFGYSLMIGLTIMTIPLSSETRRPVVRPRWARAAGLHLCSWSRLACFVVGFTYPFLISIAIITTANHFILDAVAGALVCALGWQFNGVLLNLLPLEDYFLWVVRIHKPDPMDGDSMDGIDDMANGDVLRSASACR
ncbi:integral membrane protein [Aspergillus sclerotialis]|uniref:Integral membrane protein n=1 Tax=Aspergillus sclerotialis TaxID=2070753 RepID=A0A3A2Z676_9EURO|nr:integral membrane protein [Aspergillus sclerotialis]